MSFSAIVTTSGATAWQSDRLVYRTVEVEDDPFLTSFYADSESFLHATVGLAIPRGKKYGTEWRETLNEKCLLGVIICLRPTSTLPATPHRQTDEKADQLVPIGVISLSGAAPKMLHHRCAMIGIHLLRAYQGKGYGSEAIRWVLRWSFRFGNLHRVEIGAVEHNYRALQLYENLGFVVEGRKREAVFFDGRYWDLIEMGMLRDEWKEKYDESAASSEKKLQAPI